ncbi:MAG TPA: hypothetical protein VFD55_01090 [Candidatus Angelobacter sp.]|nr:hypothetical protein [Candidatus Angelobacter sp.]
MNNDRYNENKETQNNKPNYTFRRIGFAVLVLLASYGLVKGIGLAKEGVNQLNNPYQYSDTTKNVPIPKDQGLNYAAYTIDGVDESVDVRHVVEHIEDMPENKEALSDGIQENEGIVVPVGIEKNDN